MDFFPPQQSKAMESSWCVTHMVRGNIEIAGQNRVDWPAKIAFYCRLQRRVDQHREESLFVLHTVYKHRDCRTNQRGPLFCMSLRATDYRVEQSNWFSVYHIEYCCRTKQSRPAYLPVTAGCLRRICLRKKPTLSPAAGFTIQNYFRLGSQVRLLHFLETF